MKKLRTIGFLTPSQHIKCSQFQRQVEAQRFYEIVIKLFLQKQSVEEQHTGWSPTQVLACHSTILLLSYCYSQITILDYLRQIFYTILDNCLTQSQSILDNHRQHFQTTILDYIRRMFQTILDNNLSLTTASSVGFQPSIDNSQPL